MGRRLQEWRQNACRPDVDRRTTSADTRCKQASKPACFAQVSLVLIAHSNYVWARAGARNACKTKGRKHFFFIVIVYTFFYINIYLKSICRMLFFNYPIKTSLLREGLESVRFKILSFLSLRHSIFTKKKNFIFS